MNDLTKTEKMIIASLVVILIIGLSILVWQKSRPPHPVTIGQFLIEKDAPNRSPQNRPLKKLINVNSATKGELEMLDGVGPALAERIILYREKSGPFRKIEDLEKVRGIGPQILGKIKDEVSTE